MRGRDRGQVNGEGKMPNGIGGGSNMGRKEVGEKGSGKEQICYTNNGNGHGEGETSNERMGYKKRIWTVLSIRRGVRIKGCQCDEEESGGLDSVKGN